MPERYRTRKFPPPMRRALDVAGAMAVEEITGAHVAQVLELIAIAEGRVAPARVAEIYLRLHGLEDPTATVVRTRVLAEIGLRERSAPQPEGPVLVEGPPERPNGPFRFLRERLRGRVHNDLRRWVELHVGRSEVLILDIHVRNALVFVQMLAPDISIHESVTIYRETVGVREQFTEALYWFVLSRLAENELPQLRDVENNELRIPPAPRKQPRRNGTVRSPYRTI